MMEGWETIETAPKDGTLIRIRQGGYYPCHARFKDGGWQPIEYQATQYPTHWQPAYPPKCDGCGENYADPPSNLCPGCQAFRDHQS